LQGYNFPLWLPLPFKMSFLLFLLRTWHFFSLAPLPPLSPVNYVITIPLVFAVLGCLSPLKTSPVFSEKKRWGGRFSQLLSGCLLLSHPVRFFFFSPPRPLFSPLFFPLPSLPTPSREHCEDAGYLHVWPTRPYPYAFPIRLKKVNTRALPLFFLTAAPFFFFSSSLGDPTLKCFPPPRIKKIKENALTIFVHTSGFGISSGRETFSFSSKLLPLLPFLFTPSFFRQVSPPVVEEQFRTRNRGQRKVYEKLRSFVVQHSFSFLFPCTKSSFSPSFVLTRPFWFSISTVAIR